MTETKNAVFYDLLVEYRERCEDAAVSMRWPDEVIDNWIFEYQQRWLNANKELRLNMNQRKQRTYKSQILPNTGVCREL
ncbi:MAG: hypothetical protein ACYSUX_19285, partial [Planctomycetota bacterium]